MGIFTILVRDKQTSTVRVTTYTQVEKAYCFILTCLGKYFFVAFN